MAFKLSKKEQKQHAELHKALLDAEAKVKAEFEALLEVLQSAPAALNDAIRTRNDAAHAAAEFVTGIADQWDSDYDEKGDGWKEGDRGAAVRELIDEWQGISLDSDMDEVEVVEPEIDDQCYVAEALGELRAEAD